MPRLAARIGFGLLLTCAGSIACSREVTGVRVEPSIYGSDERRELFDVPAGPLRTIATTAVPALIREANLLVVGDRAYPRGPTVGAERRLCPGELFEDQVSAAGCTATLVDEDLVLTAGHCLDTRPCAEQRYVFGWYYDAPGVLHAIHRSDVYACWQVVLVVDVDDRDFAFVQLDRAPPGPPVVVRSTRAMMGEAVSLIGYPTGVPAKFVEAGVVTELPTASRFNVRVDSLPGNSGSPILDASGSLIGELVAGRSPAFDEDPTTCTRVHVWPDDTAETDRAMEALAAIDELCASGFPSERLCSLAPTCGDGWCAPEEADACLVDCALLCGNGICEPGESGCAVDCGADAGAPDAGTGERSPDGACGRCAAAPAAPSVPWAAVLAAVAVRLSVSFHSRRPLRSESS